VGAKLADIRQIQRLMDVIITKLEGFHDPLEKKTAKSGGRCERRIKKMAKDKLGEDTRQKLVGITSSEEDEELENAPVKVQQKILTMAPFHVSY
jgi:hypothetical protein